VKKREGEENRLEKVQRVLVCEWRSLVCGESKEWEILVVLRSKGKKV